MKKLFLIPFLIMLCSCKSRTAMSFSETIVNKERSLQPEIIKTESKVKTFSDAGQFDSMAVVSEKMERLVNDRLEEIKKLKTPELEFADEFKNDAIDYFTYMKKVYTYYVKYAKAETDELKDKEMKNMQELVSKKDEVIQKMQSSQKKFADANGFRIKK